MTVKRILYLGPDLADVAVNRRVLGLRAAGAEVIAYAFDRKLDFQNDVKTLGTAADGNIRKRIANMLRAYKMLSQTPTLADVDVIYARNLDLALLAVALRRRLKRSIPIVYEVLDLHPLLLRSGLVGCVARALERFVLRRAKQLIVSSPAFLENYFAPIQGYKTAGFLLENKVEGFPNGCRGAMFQSHVRSDMPFTIVFAGKLRCEKSLQMLTTLATQAGDRLRVRLAGTVPKGLKPAYDKLAALPNTQTLGCYDYPQDLAKIYNDADLNWTLDYSSEQNAKLLIPNRLYEGGFFGVPPLLRPLTATAARAARWNAGMLLDDALLVKLVHDPHALRAELATHRARLAYCSERDFLAAGDHKRLLEALKSA